MSNMFSLKRGNELLDILTKIENTKIEYRNNLVYDKLVTYGIEIEYENISRFYVNKFIKDKYKNWISKRDNSLESGGEIVSPILNSSNSGWIQLQEICDYLKDNEANSLENASCHIHIGRQVFTTLNELIQFIELYIVYEPILFRFGYGDKISARKNIMTYASPTAKDLIAVLPDLKNCSSLEEAYIILKKLPRYRALNFSNINSDTEKKTIEFRLFNASYFRQILQNNINTVVNMVLTPHKHKIDEDLLEYKINNQLTIDDKISFWYNEVNLLKALEFVDIVFDEDLDKEYFLKQYIKGYENNFGVKGARFAKKLTK